MNLQQSTFTSSVHDLFKTSNVLFNTGLSYFIHVTAGLFRKTMFPPPSLLCGPVAEHDL